MPDPKIRFSCEGYEGVGVGSDGSSGKGVGVDNDSGNDEGVDVNNGGDNGGDGVKVDVNASTSFSFIVCISYKFDTYLHKEHFNAFGLFVSKVEI